MKRDARSADADGGGAGDQSAPTPAAAGGSPANPVAAESEGADTEGDGANRTADAESTDGRRFARVFMSGESQVVQLPKEFRFDGDRVVIRREGRHVILSPPFKDWDDLWANATPFTDDMVEAVMEQQREDIEIGRWLNRRRRGD